MENWPAKDSTAVYDYSYTIPLDAGDSVATYLFSKLSGDAVIDNDTRTDDIVTVVISGGTDGETNVFELSWTTTNGDEDREIITLAIFDSQALADESGYVDPEAGKLKLIFPKFASVSDQLVEFWLTRARRSVDQSWTEGDYQMAQMLLACHYMTLEGLGTGSEAEIAAAGLGDMKSVRSGSFQFERMQNSEGSSEKAGGLKSTTYGRQFAMLAKSNLAGPRVTPGGTIPDSSLYPSPYYSTG